MGSLRQNGASSGKLAAFRVQAWMILLAIGAFDIARGTFHWLAPDSGAGSIAGFDLSQNGAPIIYLLAVAGTSQLTFGLLEAYVAAKHRQAVLPMLALASLRSALVLATDYWIKPPGVPIPGRFAHWAVLAITTLTLIGTSCAKRNEDGAIP